MKKILIIEDEQIIREELAELLQSKGYHTISLLSYEEIMDHVRQEHPDLILLDINLEDSDGFTLCTAIRSISPVPVIFITGRDSAVDELHAFRLGGYDYITKPYNVPVLLARIHSVLKRSQEPGPSDYLEYKGIRLYPPKALLQYQDRQVELTKAELKIMYLLLLNGGRIVSRDELMEFLWDNHIHIDDNSLSVQITHVREKCRQIYPEPLIRTKRGMGYII